MPDMTIEIMQVCSARSRIVRGNIGGYEQSLDPHGRSSCTCRSFKYRKSGWCKHLGELDRQVCSYFEQVDGPPEADGVCPQCGGPTEFVRVAV